MIYLDYCIKASSMVEASSIKEADDEFNDAILACKALARAFNISVQFSEIGYCSTDHPIIKEFSLIVTFTITKRDTGDILNLSNLIPFFFNLHGFVQTKQELDFNTEEL